MALSAKSERADGGCGRPADNSSQFWGNASRVSLGRPNGADRRARRARAASSIRCVAFDYGFLGARYRLRPFDLRQLIARA